MSSITPDNHLHSPENIQEHLRLQGIGDPIVREAFAVVAKANSLPIERVESLFFSRDQVVADMVRALIQMRYPDRFENIGYCAICQKFFMQEKPHLPSH
ncbi:hypothetical protein HHS34_009215 [Acidithiobacillus montserratensis]|uniref:Uncharacterized protein n=1 Tax=Acidithiobacillus montserratensis TaxID=2729135 RepID=A0ACD5HFF4_9PROT|nr:hypothetical protein [Acidithiobacillus montserratensis]MBU2749196.1 hypothetical protein [Acidithiobacillus montserratensis]